MRYVLISMMTLALTITAVAQSMPKIDGLPGNKPLAYVKVEVRGELHVKDPIDADSKVLTEYSRYSGVEISPTRHPDLPIWFELFLGENRNLAKSAKELKKKWVIVQGDLVVVHPKLRLDSFGGRYEMPGPPLARKTPIPKYVIKVRRLEAVDEGRPVTERLPYVKFEVRGVMEYPNIDPYDFKTHAGKIVPGCFVRSDPCDFMLSMGKHNDWARQAKANNGKLVIVEGDLRSIGYSSEREMLMASLNGLPTRSYYLSITGLRSVPPEPEEPPDKK